MPPEGRRVLFLQVANPAAYPPILHAAELMAGAGWRVTLLAAPIRGSTLSMPPVANVELLSIGERPSHVVGRGVYLTYLRKAAALALSRRPDVIYASDPLSAGPALVAAQLTGARLVYHEHDTPADETLASWTGRLRRRAAARAELIVLPNAERMAVVGAELGVADKTFTIWNLPSLKELPPLACPTGDRLELYYHGSINPARLPTAVAQALTLADRPLRLRIAGYEAPGACGYVERLVELAGRRGGAALIERVGEIPQRGELLDQAAGAEVGLAFMPAETDDLNMRHMVGASNKPFDYMACGQALLVSELPQWRETFVTPGFGLACDPADVGSLTAALTWFADHPDERRAMGRAGRAKIERNWNYDSAFAPVLARLSEPKA